MNQLSLPMLTHYAGPRLVDADTLAQCMTYRDAVRMCWGMRTRRNLTLRLLADEAGIYASHLSDYLSTEPLKRELPAKHIAAFEVACGNRCITQWMTARSELTILEQFIQARVA